jgi:quercetin 2,3-dioxygenase
MIQVRRSESRGHTKLSWLDSRHSFSFDQYYDPDWMGFRQLRVINEDWVQPGQGFGTHPHRDMEIITYVLEGELEHRDSMGTGSIIRPGDLQRMTAGTGVTHSEFNHSTTSPVHLLQIWILPERRGLQPSYQQKTFPEKELAGKFRLLAAHDGSDGALSLHQNVAVYAARLAKGQTATHSLAPSRHVWVQMARGKVQLNGKRLEAGDGAAISAETKLEFVADVPSEMVLFDLA